MRALALAAFVLVPLPAAGEDTDAGAEADEAPLFEVSLGTTQLFVPMGPESDLLGVLPTTSALFLFDWFISDRFRASAVFNLPLSTEQRVVPGGGVEQVHSPPSLAAGLTWAPLSIRFRKTRRFEIHVAAMAGITTGGARRAFPLFATRLYLLHEGEVSIYLGTAFALRVETLGLIYGFGYRF